MLRCAHCTKAIKRPGDFEWHGHMLCSARCHGLYEQAMRRSAQRAAQR